MHDDGSSAVWVAAVVGVVVVVAVAAAVVGAVVVGVVVVVAMNVALTTRGLRYPWSWSFRTSTIGSRSFGAAATPRTASGSFEEELASSSSALNRTTYSDMDRWMF